MKGEANEQCSFFQWLALQYPKIDETSFAIPNGGSRHIVEAMNLKKQGVKAGVPDIFIAYPNDKYHGLFIEMKYGANKLSAHQIKMIELLKNNHYKVMVCYSWDEAKNVTMEYINNV